MKNLKINRSMNIDLDLLNKLDKEAKKESKSRSSLINDILNERYSK